MPLEKSEYKLHASLSRHHVGMPTYFFVACFQVFNSSSLSSTSRQCLSRLNFRAMSNTIVLWSRFDLWLVWIFLNTEKPSLSLRSRLGRTSKQSSAFEGGRILVALSLSSFFPLQAKTALPLVFSHHQQPSTPSFWVNQLQEYTWNQETPLSTYPMIQSRWGLFEEMCSLWNERCGVVESVSYLSSDCLWKENIPASS